MKKIITNRSLAEKKINYESIRRKKTKKDTFIRQTKDDFGEKRKFLEVAPERRNIFFLNESSQTKILI